MISNINTILLLLSLVLLRASAAPAAPQDGKPAALHLAGDSTTAPQSVGGGGWGNGFLAYLNNPAWGFNYGHDGATTVSFVTGGDWGKVLSSVKDNTAKFTCYVTIQFGHNDQKPENNIPLDKYQGNLQNMATDVMKAGGIPILVTPLTRRFFTSNHDDQDDLHDQRLATIAAAKAANAQFIDLNQASRQYVEAIGKDAAQAYNLNSQDETHLNGRGSVVFGRLVADLLLGHPPVVGTGHSKRETSPRFGDGSDLVPWIKVDKSLSDKIWNGLPA